MSALVCTGYRVSETSRASTSCLIIRQPGNSGLMAPKSKVKKFMEGRGSREAIKVYSDSTLIPL